nr:hopanoid biosynthesis associated RND transporter like protein HpnN [Virgibacillus halodenitrificans]
MSPLPTATRAPRYLAWAWLVAHLLCLVALGWLLRDGLPADTRLTAMLPEDRQAPLVEQASAKLGTSFEDRFVLLVHADDLSSTMPALAEALTGDDGAASVIDTLTWRDTDLLDDDPKTALDAYRYRLLTPEIRQSIDADGGESLVAPALKTLFSPAARPDPRRDPFGLLDAWLEERTTSRITPHDGRLSIDIDGQRFNLLIGKLATSPYAPDAQQRLTRTLEDFQIAHPEATLLRSGLIFHAAAGAEQAKHEISTIGLGALLGLIAVLLIVFRSPRVLLALLLPLGSGLLMALTLTLALFGSLHLLTLAFGASLIGIAIDYALHLQSHRAIAGRDFRLRALLPGLTLGLASSLVAYLAQTLTPLPGLRQMAVFAALGLLGAWLSVVLWLPRLRLPISPATARLATRWERLTRSPWRLKPGVVSVVAVMLLAICVWRLHSDDSLRLLSSSPDALLEQERIVQQHLGNDTGTHYLLVRGDDEATLLERLSALHTPLDTLQRQGVISGHVDLADSVPPPERQNANLARVERLYQAPLSHLFERANLPDTLAERARARLDESPLLDVTTWLDTPLGESQQRLWLGKTDDGGVAASVALQGVADGDGEAPLRQLAADTPGVTYVDRIERLSGLLGELRTHIAEWLALGLILLGMGLTLRYRRRTWRVLLPPLGATLIVLTSFAVAGIPLNVFSQLGLLLVLGIGLDAGIFNAEHPRQAAAWLAISLSTLTSLLAFGLLAFSATPALHYLGLTCLIGLAAVWGLVYLLRPGPRGDAG